MRDLKKVKSLERKMQGKLHEKLYRKHFPNERGIFYLLSIIFCRSVGIQATAARLRCENMALQVKLMKFQVSDFDFSVIFFQFFHFLLACIGTTE